MSILTNTDVVPPRLRAIYNLLDVEGKPVLLNDIEALCMPGTLFDEAKSVDRRMVKSNIKEGLAVGLFVDSSDLSIALADEVPRGNFRRAITERIFGSGEQNLDLLKLIAWYLTLDPLRPPAGWAELENKQVEQVRDVGLVDVAMNDTKLGQINPWIRFLGFAWSHKPGADSMLVPDPTDYLQILLPTLLGPRTEREMPIGAVLQRIAEVCPVLEGGFVRRELDSAIEQLDSNHLSRSSAQAWLRLHDRNFAQLVKYSDTTVYVFPDGDTDHRFTHLKW